MGGGIGGKGVKYCCLCQVCASKREIGMIGYSESSYKSKSEYQSESEYKLESGAGRDVKVFYQVKPCQQ